MIFVDDGHNPEIVCAISGSPDRQSSDNCTDDSTSADWVQCKWYIHVYINDYDFEWSHTINFYKCCVFHFALIWIFFLIQC